MIQSIVLVFLLCWWNAVNVWPPSAQYRGPVSLHIDSMLKNERRAAPIIQPISSIQDGTKYPLAVLTTSVCILLDRELHHGTPRENHNLFIRVRNFNCGFYKCCQLIFERLYVWVTNYSNFRNLDISSGLLPQIFDPDLSQPKKFALARNQQASSVEADFEPCTLVLTHYRVSVFGRFRGVERGLRGGGGLNGHISSVVRSAFGVVQCVSNKNQSSEGQQQTANSCPRHSFCPNSHFLLGFQIAYIALLLPATLYLVLLGYKIAYSGLDALERKRWINGGLRLAVAAAIAVSSALFLPGIGYWLAFEGGLAKFL